MDHAYRRAVLFRVPRSLSDPSRGHRYDLIMKKRKMQTEGSRVTARINLEWSTMAHIIHYNTHATSWITASQLIIIVPINVPLNFATKCSEIIVKRHFNISFFLSFFLWFQTLGKSRTKTLCVWTTILILVYRNVQINVSLVVFAR